jgi:hypothetical protein
MPLGLLLCLNMSNKLMITLRPDHRSRLMASVRKDSEIWHALHNGTRFSWQYGSFQENTYAVICDEAGARLLRFCSRKNCRDATQDIESAIRGAHRLLH